MADSSTTGLPDVAILTRAVENVFRRLIKMLVGKISLKKLQEMIQVIFIEEAEAKLQLERPGKNVPMSTLAVVTGYDTRTLTRIKSSEAYMKPFHRERRFLSQITPECSVLDVWESSPKYLDLETGKPMDLPLKGEPVSFVGSQIRGALAGISAADAATMTLAYEPIWAIGTGLTATPEDANNIIKTAIRDVLVELYDEATAESIRVQYGGSVKPNNMADFIVMPEIDGALVGGASLKADSFSAIVRNAIAALS